MRPACYGVRCNSLVGDTLHSQEPVANALVRDTLQLQMETI